MLRLSDGLSLLTEGRTQDTLHTAVILDLRVYVTEK